MELDNLCAHAVLFVKLAKTITRQRSTIASSENNLSNARVEAANTIIGLIARRAFGFHFPEALIALAKLTFSGLCPPPPGRVHLTRGNNRRAPSATFGYSSPFFPLAGRERVEVDLQAL